MDLRLLLHTGKSLERCTVAFIKGISLPLQTILSLMHTGRKWNGSPGPWEATVVALYSQFGEGKNSPASLGLCCSPAKYFKFPKRSGGEMPALSFTQKPFGASQCLMPSKTRERLCTVRWQAEGSCISSSRCVSAIFISQAAATWNPGALLGVKTREAAQLPTSTKHMFVRQRRGAQAGMHSPLPDLSSIVRDAPDCQLLLPGGFIKPWHSLCSCSAIAKQSIK